MLHIRIFCLSLLLACSSLFAEAPVEEKYPVFTADKTVLCPECGKNEYKVFKAPFSVRFDSTRLVGVLSPDMGDLEFFYAMSVSDNILESNVNELYIEYIRKMRMSASDSSYFAGTLKLNIWLSGGSVREVFVEKTTTGNRAFDEAVLKCVRRWSFPVGKDEPPVLSVCLHFIRTGASGTDAEIRKFGHIRGGSAH